MTQAAAGVWANIAQPIATTAVAAFSSAISAGPRAKNTTTVAVATDTCHPFANILSLVTCAGQSAKKCGSWRGPPCIHGNEATRRKGDRKEAVFCEQKVAIKWFVCILSLVWLFSAAECIYCCCLFRWHNCRALFIEMSSFTICCPSVSTDCNGRATLLIISLFQWGSLITMSFIFFILLFYESWSTTTSCTRSTWMTILRGTGWITSISTKWNIAEIALALRNATTSWACWSVTRKVECPRYFSTKLNHFPSYRFFLEQHLKRILVMQTQPQKPVFAVLKNTRLICFFPCVTLWV